MKEIILQIDTLLGMLEVKGNSVLILADARKALGEAYTLAKERESAASASDKPDGEQIAGEA